MESNIKTPSPTNLLTSLLGEPESPSFGDENPVWFSSSLLFLVSARCPAARCLTFERLKYLVKSLASGLRKKGLKPGDRLLFVSPETIYMPVFLLATIAAGGIFVGRRPDFSAAQEAIIIKHCEPAFIVAYLGFEGIAAQGARLANVDAQIFSYDDESFEPHPSPNYGYGGSVSCSKILDSVGASTFRWRTLETEADMETTALIVYTTGTTDDPRGVELTHRGLLAACTDKQHMLPPSSHQEDWIHNFSSAYFGAIGVFLLALRNRSRLTVYDFPTFNPDYFLRSIALHRCSVVWATKQAFDAIATRTPDFDLSHVSTFLTGGAVIPQVTRQTVNTYFGNNVVRVSYATSETCGAISVEPLASPAGQTTSVGKVLPHVQSRVVDDEGRIVASDEQGNLHWKTPAVMKSYWRNPEATKKILSADGWIDSGDVGFFDGNGTLHITGRIKEVLKVNGRPVSPACIEEVLMQMPGITQVCVVGVRDQRGEDLLRAVIVRNENCSVHEAGTAETAENDVYAFMRANMNADHQLTGGVVFVPEEWLPYGGNGKLLRREVQRRFQREFDAANGMLWQDREQANGVKG